MLDLGLALHSAHRSRLGTMQHLRRRLQGASCILVAALAVGVGALATACGNPSAVQPTLDALGTLGYTCGEGTPDNVPSGLTEWVCTGPSEGSSAVDVDGNQDGVAELTLVLTWPDLPKPDPNATRDEYRRVVRSVPPLDAAPALEDALADWAGEQMARTIGGARVSAECLQSQCVVTIASTPNPIEPLRLP